MNVLGQFLDDREDRPKPSPGRASEAATAAPEAMLERLLERVNATFYAKAEARIWLRDKPAVMMVLTWPATWLTQRGVGLPVERYEAILREVLDGIRKHGAVDSIKHFPTYFGHAVRQHFVHQGDALYEERKRLRSVLDMEALRTAATRRATGPDPMEALAAAHRVLKAGKPKAKPAADNALELPFL